MNKKLIIAIAAGVMSFSGGFGYAWFARAAAVSAGPAEPVGAGTAGTLAQEGVFQFPEAEAVTVGIGGRGAGPAGKGMTDEQLKELVYEIQQRAQEYRNKLDGLAKEEQRLQMAQEMLKKDIENLNDLRMKLASMVVRLKDERDKLLKSRVEVSREEKENLQSIATAYDKMDSTAAGKILTSMCAGAEAVSGRRVLGGAGSNMDDAVKILYYMAEKTKAKVLAELVNSEPGLAAVLCERLKRVTEQE